MTDIVAANVSYSFSAKDREFKGRRGFSNRGTISFGNGSLTYPSGGIPITKAKVGCPRVLRSIDIFEGNAKGYAFEFDVSASTIRIFQAAGATPAGTISAPTISFASAAGNVADDKVIGVNALSNGAALVANTALVNVIGVQAPTFTGNAIAAGALVELTGGSSAVLASVLEVDCEGY